MDREVAERLAREHLAGELGGEVAADGGHLMDLLEVCDEIAAALEAGEKPDRADIGRARTHLRQVSEDLDDVCALYEIPRWETNVRSDELTEDEREEYREAR